MTKGSGAVAESAPERFVFIGDSITDSGRDRANPASLGCGYVLMAAARLQLAEPFRRIEVINRGINGHRSIDLEGRWQSDCLDLMPNVLTILIGVNDTLRTFDAGKPSPIDEFEARLRDLLVRAERCCAPTIVLLEPFLVPVKPDQCAWREDLDRRIHAVRRVAADRRALLVPTDRLLAEVAACGGPRTWAADGIHPTPAGHGLIARAWVRTLLRHRAAASYGR